MGFFKKALGKSLGGKLLKKGMKHDPLGKKIVGGALKKDPLMRKTGVGKMLGEATGQNRPSRSGGTVREALGRAAGVKTGGNSPATSSATPAARKMSRLGAMGSNIRNRRRQTP